MCVNSQLYKLMNRQCFKFTAPETYVHVFDMRINIFDTGPDVQGEGGLVKSDMSGHRGEEGSKNHDFFADVFFERPLSVLQSTEVTRRLFNY